MTLETVFQSLNIALIVGIIGAILLVLGAFKFYKSKDAKKMATLVGIVGIGIFLVGAFVPGVDFLVNPIDFSGGTPVATVTPTAPSTVQETPSGLCPGIEDTTVTLSAQDQFTSAAAGTTHRYRVNGAPALTVANAGTFTASPGNPIEILWGNETDGTYYGAVSNVVVPCSGTKTFTTNLVRNGTLTVEVFNEEGNLINGVANNETLAAGDVVTLEAKLKGQFQRGFPYGGVITVEYNSSTIDDVIVDFGGSETNVPQTYVITLATSSVTKAYTVPAILSNEILLGSVIIDADDSTAPADPGSDVILQFRPNDYFINEDTGGSYDGPEVEDEDDTATFANTATFTIHTM